MIIKTRNFNCPVEVALDLINGKWKPRIIWFLGQGELRFRELERLLPETRRKVLVEQLRQLEADGIVSRTVYPQVPPKVVYALTAHAFDLLPIFQILKAWSLQHIENTLSPLSRDSSR